jgi:hypothetical protein
MDKPNPHLGIARTLATFLDAQFSFLGIKFGFDSLIGLIPGIGDLAGLFLSLYLIWIGYQMKVPQPTLMKMVLNVGIDTLIGAVPIIGDIGDVFFKANLRNLRILEDFDRAQRTGASGVVEGDVIRQ